MLRRLLLMVLATRLLMAGGAAGAFTPPATVPPFDASWSRSGANPIMVPAIAWEETALQEAFVRHTSAGWQMWFTGGWTHEATGYATSSDGIAWTKYASNPVFGQGGSGYAGGSNCPEIVVVGSTHYLYATDNAVPVVNVTTSSDGIAWTIQASSISLAAGQTLWGNRVVWIEGGAWKMLQEQGQSGGIWQTYLYTSSDGLSWTIGNSGNPLTTLQVGTGMYGGPSFAEDAFGQKTPKFGGVYHLWYHASTSPGPNSDIYTATSLDLITWTIGNGGSPVLTHTGSGFEVDQAADANVVVVGGMAYLFYEGVDNTAQIAKIGVATAPATH